MFRKKCLETTRFDYNYYRTYDPSTGRYLESDPIGLASGLNTYAYVSNMPTMLTDRFGLYEGDGTAPYFGEDWDRTYPPGYAGWQPLPPCKHPFLQRALDRFATTNQALPGLLAPTGLGILTAGSMGRATGSPTFLQLLQTMRTGEFVSGAARLTRLEAAISAGGLSVVNTAYAGLAFESGVAAGSLIGAAILPCERETEDECSK